MNTTRPALSFGGILGRNAGNVCGVCAAGGEVEVSWRKFGVSLKLRSRLRGSTPMARAHVPTASSVPLFTARKNTFSSQVRKMPKSFQWCLQPLQMLHVQFFFFRMLSDSVPISVVFNVCSILQKDPLCLSHPRDICKKATCLEIQCPNRDSFVALVRPHGIYLNTSSHIVNLPPYRPSQLTRPSFVVRFWTSAHNTPHPAQSSPPRSAADAAHSTTCSA